MQYKSHPDALERFTEKVFFARSGPVHLWAVLSKRKNGCMLEDSQRRRPPSIGRRFRLLVTVLAFFRPGLSNWRWDGLSSATFDHRVTTFVDSILHGNDTKGPVPARTCYVVFHLISSEMSVSWAGRSLVTFAFVAPVRTIVRKSTPLRSWYGSIFMKLSLFRGFTIRPMTHFAYLFLISIQQQTYLSLNSTQ